MQLHGVPTLRAIQAVLRREGVRGLYGGIAAAGLGAGCALSAFSPRDALLSGLVLQSTYALTQRCTQPNSTLPPLLLGRKFHPSDPCMLRLLLFFQQVLTAQAGACGALCSL